MSSHHLAQVSLRFPSLGIVLVSAVIVGLLNSPLPAQHDAAPRNFQTDDLFELKDVGDARVSPDGDWVAYTVSKMDLKENKTETSIWMVPAAGGDEIRMTAKGYSATQPRWSPDGKYLSFKADRNGSKAQVWAFDRRGGDTQPLTDVKQGIETCAWSPDGSRVLLTIQDPEPEDVGDAGKSKEQRPRPWVIDRLQFKRDYTGYLDRRRTHLYVFDLASRALTQITSGDYDDSEGTWSPD